MVERSGGCELSAVVWAADWSICSAEDCVSPPNQVVGSTQSGVLEQAPSPPATKKTAAARARCFDNRPNSNAMLMPPSTRPIYKAGQPVPSETVNEINDSCRDPVLASLAVVQAHSLSKDLNIA